jgi:hypothetical protein
MNRNWKDVILILGLIFAMASSIALAQDMAPRDDSRYGCKYGPDARLPDGC